MKWIAREPTPEMKVAGMEADMNTTSFYRIFRAMWDAAPQVDGVPQSNLLAQIEHILAGIDETENESDAGWWETSVGAKFGAERLQLIRTLFATPRSAQAQEPLRWESTTPAYIRFITDNKYQKLSEEARRWYRPICDKCIPQPAQAHSRFGSPELQALILEHALAAAHPSQSTAAQEQEKDARLHAFLDAAAGEGFVIGGIDAGDLYAEVFPDRYAAALSAQTNDQGETA
jgi:hypothetical protein